MSKREELKELLSTIIQEDLYDLIFLAENKLKIHELTVIRAAVKEILRWLDHDCITEEEVQVKVLNDSRTLSVTLTRVNIERDAYCTFSSSSTAYILRTMRQIRGSARVLLTTDSNLDLGQGRVTIEIVAPKQNTFSAKEQTLLGIYDEIVRELEQLQCAF